MAKIRIYHSLFERELADIDRMIEENLKDIATARSKAQREGLRGNIERLESARDDLLDRAYGRG